MWNSPSHVTPPPHQYCKSLSGCSCGKQRAPRIRMLPFLPLSCNISWKVPWFLGFYCTIWEKEIRWFLPGSICKAFCFSVKSVILKKEKLSNNYKVKNTENTQPTAVTLQKNHELTPQARLHTMPSPLPLTHALEGALHWSHHSHYHHHADWEPALSPV